MRKVLYAMTASLDGYVEDANGSLDWSVPDVALHQHFNDREREFDLLLYGRRLYETMKVWGTYAQDHPSATAVELEFAEIWNNKPKVVFSTTLDKVEWNSRLVRGNVEEEVKRLKSEPGKYMAVGGPGLAASLMRLGLIDEYWVYVAPIILGGGKRMLPELKEPIVLQLLETRNLSGGVTMLRYEDSS